MNKKTAKCKGRQEWFTVVGQASFITTHEWSPIDIIVVLHKGPFPSGERRHRIESTASNQESALLGNRHLQVYWSPGNVT